MRGNPPASPFFPVACIIAVIACSDGSDPAAPPPTPGVHTISVEPAEAIFSYLGETVEFTAIARDQSGIILPGTTITWSSSNPAVVSVQSTGRATASGNGQAEIRASSAGVSGTAAAAVTQVAVSVALAPDVVEFEALGDTLRLSASVEDAGGSPIDDAAISWSSADTSVVRVDSDGLLTAIGVGSATIEAVADPVQAVAQVSVDQLLDALVFVAAPDTLTFLGETFALEAEGRDALDNPIPTVSIEWVSQDPSVISVDEAGIVSAISNGVGVVQARSGEITIETQIVVRQRSAALGILSMASTTVAGEPFDNQPEVEIRDSGGHRVTIDSETVVAASIETGNGELLGTTEALAADGIVQFVDLAIGGRAGEWEIVFSAEGLDDAVAPPVHVTPGSAVALLAVSGDGQTAPADTELSEPLAVAVHDTWSNGVPGVTVEWNVASGGGALSAQAVVTDDDGIGSTQYTLGRHAGEETVEARSDGLDGSPIVFTSVATPNATITGVVSTTSAHITQLAAAGVPAEMRGGPPGPGLIRPSARTRTPLELPGSHGQRPPHPRQTLEHEPEYVPGELIVTFRNEAIDAPSRMALARASVAETSRLGDRMRAQLENVRTEHANVLPPPVFRVAGVSPVTLAARIRVESADIEEVRRRLLADERIRSAERNYIIRRQYRVPAHEPEPPVSDPLYPWQAWHYGMIGLPDAWKLTTGSSSVIVAVVDDGIRFDHPNIAANLTADGYDFVSNDYDYPICGGGSISRSGDGDGYDPDPTTPMVVELDPTFDCITAVTEVGGHGLHVAGTIGATTNDGYGGAGANWSVSIRPVRVLDIAGRATSYDLAQGILFAAGLPADDGNGGHVQASVPAHVINLSLGGPSIVVIEQLAVQLAAEAGSLLIASAGNSSTSAPSYPAAYPEVISVSAVNPFGELASYSNHGSTIELAAPGGDLAFGCDFGVVSAQWNFTVDQPAWKCLQGTSMAAPHVSGAAALLFAYEPGISATQVRARLRDYAVDLGAPGWDASFGYGLVNARNALTRTFESPGDVRVRLLNAETGQVVAETAAPGGSYQFTELDDGGYIVYGGQDRNGDGLVGIPGRRWGAFGGTSNPAAVTLDGAGEYATSFTIGFPLEEEPNDGFADANELPVNAYIRGVISEIADGDVDVFRVQVPSEGSYIFETSGFVGMCGFALEEDTFLQLYDSVGNLLAEHDDIDPSQLLFCSRISVTLDPGIYYVAVWGNIGVRRYQLHARKEN